MADEGGGSQAEIPFSAGSGYVLPGGGEMGPLRHLESQKENEQ